MVTIPFRPLFVALSLIASIEAQSLAVAVPATGDPFLAGQAAGVTTKGDVAPAQSPFQVPVVLAGGQIFNFLNTAGLVNFVPSPLFYPPEGGISYIANSAAALGVSGYAFPACALVGVFLPDTVNGGAAPANQDATTPASRDFASLSPELFQIFYIGDGLRNDLTTIQDFVAPVGATRLFLGTADGSGWYNNGGQFTLTVATTPGASVTTLGPGCAGGVSPALAISPPSVSGSFTLSIAGPTLTAGTLFVSAPPASALDLGGGCFVYLDLFSFVPLFPVTTDASGAWSVTLPLNGATFLVGLQLAAQGALIAPGSPLGLELTNGALMTFGL